MSKLPKILEFNHQFVASKAYESYQATRLPDKKIVIVTCMDTRLTELLPKAMNLRNGDAKIIKIAGAVVAAPFGSVMRSIMIAVYSLGIEEVFVIGHHDCAMSGVRHENMLDVARASGIDEDRIKMLQHAGVDLKGWLSGFDCPAEAVHASVKMIRNHPMLPARVRVHGLIMDPVTGALELLIDGNSPA